MKSFAWLLLIIYALVLLNGCNTVEGFGEDLASLGGRLKD